MEKRQFVTLVGVMLVIAALLTIKSSIGGKVATTGGDSAARPLPWDR